MKPHRAAIGDEIDGVWAGLESPENRLQEVAYVTFVTELAGVVEHNVRVADDRLSDRAAQLVTRLNTVLGELQEVDLEQGTPTLHGQRTRQGDLPNAFGSGHDELRASLRGGLQGHPHGVLDLLLNHQLLDPRTGSIQLHERQMLVVQLADAVQNRQDAVWDTD